MLNNFETIQKFNKEQLEAANAAAATLTKGLQKIAAEATDYSKAAFEKNSAAFEKLVAAKTPDAAFQIQSEFAKSAYEGFVAQVNKMGELYTSVAKEAFKPVEVAFTKATEVAKKAA
ncbi:MAG: phasin family protein [Hyphomicrobiales bacterium]|nr:phasin family protein [Hyphomicrobiales bacterium]MDE2114897.1 phasin family protein [Hyphomicrobiales bacterium]